MLFASQCPVARAKSAFVNMGSCLFHTFKHNVQWPNTAGAVLVWCLVERPQHKCVKDTH